VCQRVTPPPFYQSIEAKEIIEAIETYSCDPSFSKVTNRFLFAALFWPGTLFLKLPTAQNEEARFSEVTSGTDVMKERPPFRAFISSTYLDLKEHRVRVIDTLRRSGIHVDPMEDWTADEREPKQFSQERVDGCQLCIVLVAFRRGYLPVGETLSITQMEYHHALRTNVGVLPFLLGDEEPWPRRFDEMDRDPGIRVWREELKQKHGVGNFSFRPETLDVGPAVTRWLQQAGTEARRRHLPSLLQAQADRNLLFGILALQMDFISRDALIAAMHAWVLDKSNPLGQILQDQGALRADTRALLDALVERHPAMHNNDPHQSLAAVSSPHSVRLALEQVSDANVQGSLAHVSVAYSESIPVADGLPTEPGQLSPHSRFQILRLLDHGNLGQVSVAFDWELQREVALKEIQPRFVDNPDARRRFLFEGEITGKLEHPGIVPIYGMGQTADGRPYYAMRLVHGESLQKAIDRFHSVATSTLSPTALFEQMDRLLDRFVQACYAVGYAHSAGVIHRDLKPDNILLGPFGETLVVDWGLARFWKVPDGGGRAQVDQEAETEEECGTRMGEIVGTPAFMPPEQATRRLDQMSPPSDVYSLGATLYTLLTGQAPFTGNDVRLVLEKVCRGDFASPRAIRPYIPNDLEAICLKAMALDPTDRQESAVALAHDLETYLSQKKAAVQAFLVRLQEHFPVELARQVLNKPEMLKERRSEVVG
jgi:hypothetical protein